MSKNIHETAIIEDNVIIECNNFTLGKGSIIKSGCIITCNEFNAGGGLYMSNNVEVGRGGCHGPDSNVFIGNNVGIFENTIINPSAEVHIGNTVIGIGSIINRSLPSGCFAAGSPCRVIKEDCYPKQLSSDQKREIVSDIVADWYLLHASKNIQGIDTQCTGETIRLQQGEHSTIYNLTNRIIDGYENEVTEDLRDYLRRRGIKIFTENRFRSIKPTWQL